MTYGDNTVLICHIAVSNLALNFWTEERWISQDKTTKKLWVSTCHHGGNQPSNGVSDQDRRRKSESLYQTNYIVGVSSYR